MRIRIAMMMVCGLAAWGGCSRDARLTGHNIRKDVTVGPVTHYGVKLDKEASPEQVAYVALRAIREDFLSSSPEEREAALDKQFDVSAAGVIARKNRTSRNRDEFVYQVVYQWTPTVSHYVHDFETDWKKAKARFVVNGPRPMRGTDANVMECEVLMEVADPTGDPNADVVMVIYLARDKGYWRVIHLGFDPTRRSLAAVEAGKP
jgi:hypothetical protein